MSDPGLDRHEWETAWESLQEPLGDAPAETLPELWQLVERMLAECGLGLDDDGMVPPGPELLLELRAARGTALRLERGEEVDPYELGEAVHDLRGAYSLLIDRPGN
jgi:hypothetical protein